MKNLTGLNGRWNKITKKLKQNFEQLTDDDLLLDDDLILMEGKQEEMMCRLQTKLGKTKKEIRQLILEL